MCLKIGATTEAAAPRVSMTLLISSATPATALPSLTKSVNFSVTAVICGSSLAATPKYRASIASRMSSVLSRNLAAAAAVSESMMPPSSRARAPICSRPDDPRFRNSSSSEPLLPNNSMAVADSSVSFVRPLKRSITSGRTLCAWRSRPVASTTSMPSVLNSFACLLFGSWASAMFLENFASEPVSASRFEPVSCAA